METVITKQIAKQKRRDKSQFTSQLMTLDNSGAEKQQHHILLHHMVLMGVTNFCSQEGGGRGGGGGVRGLTTRHVQCYYLSEDSKEEQPDGSGHTRHTRGTQGEGNDTIVLGKHVHWW